MDVRHTPALNNKKSSRLRTVVSILVMYLIWSFDFRASSEQTYAIYIQSTAVLASMWAFFERMGRPNWALPKELNLVLSIFFVFVVESSILGIINRQELVLVGSLALPIILFIMFSIYSYDVFLRVESIQKNISILIYIVIFGVLARFIIAFGLHGLAVEEVRYQILSGATTMAAAATVASFFSTFSFQIAVLTALNFFAIVLSVTRTEVAVIFVMASSLILAAPKVLLRFTILFRILAICGVIFPAFLFAELYETNLVSRWIDRLTVADSLGYDVTTATRRAEVDWQIEVLSSSPFAASFGLGIAAPNRLTGLFAAILRDTPGLQAEADVVDIGYGHNIYTGVLYTGGLLFGGMMNFAFLLLLIKAFKTLSAATLHMKRSKAAYVAVWGSLTVIGVVTMGFLGGVLGDRGTAIWFGTGVGMMFAGAKAIHPVRTDLLAKAATLPTTPIPALGG